MARPKKYTDKWLKRLTVKMKQYLAVTELPLKQHFASQNKFASEYLSIWAKDKEWFSQAIKRFEDVCTYKWVIAKDINPAVKIFTLKNIAHWRDDMVHIDNSKHLHQTYVWNDNGHAKPDDSRLREIENARQ